MTVEEVKAYLRLETAAEDAVVARLLSSAQGLCEAFLGQVLVAREVVEVLPAGSAWQRLGAGPVAAITAVARISTDGGVEPLSVGDYAIDIDPGGDGWVRAGGSGRVRVTYRAGLSDEAAGVPAAIGQGVVRLAAHLYAHRDEAGAPPAAVAALWRPFRRLRLGLETRA
jgi:uncharacterized phiE125 gp8 family phage protein